MVDAATVNDFLYDQPVNLTTPPVLATNVLGRLAKATFPTGAVSFSYDGLGRVNTQTFTDTTTAPVGVYVEKHTYHGDGSLSALDLLLPDTGFTNEHVDYRYDSAGRTRSVKYSDGTINQDRVRRGRQCRHRPARPHTPGAVRLGDVHSQLC